jgi:chloramphenicol-sensitive protein RarD
MSAAPQTRDDMTGILFAGFSYVFWGFMPLYWRLLGKVPPFELTVHRVFWCALFVALVAIARRRTPHIAALFREPRIIATLALTSVLISINWTTYIYAIASHQLVEASLGYYITPLISIGLGVVMLGEHISRLRLAAIVLTAIAVLIQSFALGHFSWIAVTLSLSFGFYGFFRKTTHVDSFDALTIETFLLFPFTSALILYWATHDAGAFPHAGVRADALLILGGPLTALPLVLFAAGVRRIRLSTLGFLQYLNPTITLILATLGFGEHFTRTDVIAFGCVWAALAIVALDSRFSRVKESISNPELA